MPFDLVDVTLSPDKKKDLVASLTRRFRASVTARSNQVESKLTRWKDNYAAKPKVERRTTPFFNASNFIPQLIRMHTDILAARMIGLLFGTKPFWKPSTMIPYPAITGDHMMALQEWMNWQSFTQMNFFESIDISVFLMCKTGLQVLKAPWEKKSFFLGNSNADAQSLKEVSSEGMRIDVIPFDDFFPSIVTARTLEDVPVKFHRLRFNEEEVDLRKNMGWWDKKACDFLKLQGSNDSSTARMSDAMATGITLTDDVSRPLKAIEATLDYELEPGKMVPIIAVFNPMFEGVEESLLKLYYNPFNIKLDNYVDFRILPREDLLWGYSIPEMLEQAQEEQAQIHNQRRDSSTIANIPAWKKKRFADVGNPSTEWYPGKVFEVENMDDIEPMSFNTSYNSMIEEEQLIIQLAERYSGISPAMQGMGAGSMGKKGIYANSATLALLSEGNKRLDIYLKRFRNPFNKLGRIIFQSHRQFRPDGSEYKAWGQNGQRVQQLFSKAGESTDGFAGVFFELGASDASANKEVDRTNLMVMSNTMAAYYRQIMEAAQFVVALPDNNPVKPIGMAVLKGARELANRLLFVFDVGQRDQLLPDIAGIVGQEGGQQAQSITEQGGVPQAEESVSVGQLSDLSSRLAAVTDATRGGSSNGEGSGGGRVV